MNFVAPEPKENATIAFAQGLAKVYETSAGLVPTIYANPTSGSPAGPLGGLVAFPDFAKDGVPTDVNTPLYLSFQFPGTQFTDNYNVGLINLALKAGKSLTGALA
jgi:hypothetical protein